MQVRRAQVGTDGRARAEVSRVEFEGHASAAAVPGFEFRGRSHGVQAGKFLVEAATLPPHHDGGAGADGCRGGVDPPVGSEE